MKYRKKPVIINAVQWTGRNKTQIFNFTKDAFIDDNGNLGIHTLEGDHAAGIGDYIIKGVKGEFYPCKADIFEQTYERAGD